MLVLNRFRTLHYLTRIPRLSRTMATAESIAQEISQQTALFNDLRKQQAEASVIDEVKKKLGELKRSLASLTGESSKDGGKKNKERILLKTPKVCCVQVRAVAHAQAYQDVFSRARATTAPARCTAASTSRA